MPTVEVKDILSVPIEQAWRAICDVETYPRLMPPVQRLTIKRSEGLILVTEWEVELKGSILCWTQEEFHNEGCYTLDYHQIDGDLERFDGFWKLEPLGESSTAATLSVDFEIGIPMLKDMLNPVAERALRENAISMLRALDLEATTVAAR